MRGKRHDRAVDNVFRVSLCVKQLRGNLRLYKLIKSKKERASMIAIIVMIGIMLSWLLWMYPVCSFTNYIVDDLKEGGGCCTPGLRSPFRDSSSTM